MTARWNALILAAGRGPDDPMAKAYGVANKTTIAVGGVPMLSRVVAALEASGEVATITVAIERSEIARDMLGTRAEIIGAAESAPASVIAAISAGKLTFPVVVTTGDHALLTPEMVRHFCAKSEESQADFTAGLARAETILAAYPQSVRTFFRLGHDRVSGCNLFALRNPRALRLLERWRYLEQVRKKPWRLVAAFGILSLLRFLTGRIDLDGAFATVSRKLELIVKPVVMPWAEAAIDIDKPADKELAELILARRG
ncbi:MAG: nucleotidyltransferase family protein [Alphaproteobacteria bacterium]|nr:nucleotidyltransferase family protein [Alphaproteobacteria bacterium]